MSDLIIAIAAVIIGLVLLFGGTALGVKAARKEAVQQGHAEFYVTTNTDVGFRWKTNCVHLEEKR